MGVTINNLAHRHLSVGQKAMFAQARFKAEQEKAKERQRATLKQGDTVPVVATLPPREEQGKSRDKVGDKVGVSGRSVDKAAKIEQHRPDLAEQVKQGKLDLEPAYRETKKTEAQKKTQSVEKVEAPRPAKQTALSMMEDTK